MSNLLDKGNAQYIALETFKKNGQAVNTPVWVIHDGTRLLAVTSGKSWKAKRIRNNPRVRVAESDSQGNPQSEFVEGVARILDDEAAVNAQWQRIYKKYGLLARAFKFFGRIRGDADDQVVIEITELTVA